MADFDRSRFQAKVAEMFDDQLIALLSINARSYAPEALEVAQAEAVRRGIETDVQTVKFDIFLNAGQYAGRLILLEEQLMFLSTGLAASSGNAGLAGEVYQAQRSVASAELDFSALDNKGSWIYFLDQIKECRADSTFLSGPELQFSIEEEDGTIFNGKVVCGELTRSEADVLAHKILSARDSLANKQ